MTDPEFMSCAEMLLQAIEAACDRINAGTDADIDNQRTGGMLTLVFANRSQIVVNLQKPLHEVWLAAKAGGFHFHRVAGTWQDTKGQGEFYAILNQQASAQSGQTLQFLP